MPDTEPGNAGKPVRTLWRCGFSLLLVLLGESFTDPAAHDEF